MTSWNGRAKSNLFKVKDAEEYSKLCKMCIKNRKETLTRGDIIQISIEGWPTIEEELDNN